MKRTAVIFGASLAGQRAFEYYGGEYRILGFADNDPSRAGTRLKGLPVHSPEPGLLRSVDCILVGSGFAGPITRQLLEAGIPEERIGWIADEVLQGRFEGVSSLRRLIIAAGAFAILLAMALLVSWFG